ncbi:tripartite tricarboxylate transporter substrate binding protein [Sinorhizobium mexicanum]|uniref:Tripartite tricarboxylate transporter substrate binding protein n=1 Tax=Sinorhizobium mexicanum TaxID=375549 RepID=A0A859QD58_9HYPH|nr:tripartite tricarboxylate transporter substrate binding protein [Sinorhizobium mexicanum]MBP1888192.1 tripartite-type tricarboxylate transporter receptor subunit TctC [Sinorhizobium mexicanum]QLL62963.1 tripartite tricarboxylate transporter substrate binding protein [Sinorhizobium mexicanum]
MRCCVALLTALTVAAWTSAAQAEYPGGKVITYIVPFAPGGGADVGVRIAEPFLEKCVGGDIVVIDKPGAGGTLGMIDIAAAAPDGYTIGSLLTPNLPVGTIAVNAPRYTMESFDYLANLVSTRVAISAKKGGRFKTIQDLLAAAKTSPIQAAITQAGADDHLVLLRLMEATGAKFDFIPMVESPQARNAVMGGHVEILGLSVTESANFKDQLETLAVAGTERFSGLPDVPTLKEIGYDITGGNTFLVGAPKGLPPEIKDKLNKCFQQVAEDPAYRQAIAQRNFIFTPMNAKETETFAKGEYTALKRIWDTSPWIK